MAKNLKKIINIDTTSEISINIKKKTNKKKLLTSSQSDKRKQIIYS